MVTLAADRLYEEVAYVAYHFHWSFDELLDLEHPVRRRFVEEIGRGIGKGIRNFKDATKEGNAAEKAEKS